MTKILKIFFITLLVCFAFLMILIQFTLPSYKGIIYSEHISNPIEIYRDDFGMPIIKANNDNDLAFGIGYAMAQDRLFQMDLIRRAIQGKLSEILGENLINVDKFFLTITAGRSIEEMYKNYPEHIKQIMQSYSDGVNYFINQNRLPVEFHILGYKPEEWKPEDSLSVFYYMSYNLNMAYDTEILFYILNQKFGYQKAKELFPDYIPQKGEILETSLKESPASLNFLLSFLNTIDQIQSTLGTQRIGASNNWVISKEKSLTNTPIVASDMHLEFGLPGIWYEAQLITPDMNVSGVLLPGIPFVVVGANEYVAWAFTNVMADDADFYIELLDPQNENQYLYRGQYRNFDIEKKLFRIKTKNGFKEEEFFIKKSIHGPVINSIYPLKTKEVFSLKWTAYDHYFGAIALYIANHAKNIDELEKAIEYFKTPGQNWVYADKDGNIGYTAAVGIPIRRGFNGLLPVPGWTGTYEWFGYVPTYLQPRIRNPKKGWIATANNKHSSNYPYTISNYYHYPDRYERIKQLLNAKEKFSIEDIKTMQKDIKLLLAEELTPLILEALSEFDFSNNPDAIEFMNELKHWDYNTEKTSIASSIFHILLQQILFNTFYPHLGEELFKQYLKKQFIPINALRIQLKENNAYWFDNPETEKKETRNEVIYNSFLKTIEILKNYSNNKKDWEWGKIHQLEYKHPFGKNPLLRKIVNRGPYPVEGSISTISPMDFSFEQSLPFYVIDGASERLILLPGNINESLRIIPTGISGNPFSLYYGNQIKMFLNYEYRKFTLIKPDDNKKDFTHTYRLQILPVYK